MARKKAPKKPHVPKPKSSGKWREQPGAGSAGSATHSQMAAGHPAGSGEGLMELSGHSASGMPGLSGVLLELVGEGHIGMGHALFAWQREQERIANRAWRRPGGLQRMGGL